LFQNSQEFAIKIIDKEHLQPDSLQSLKNELTILGIVDHPNIVRVYEYFETNECIFIVMEVMVGGELFDRIVEKEHYSESEAAKTIRPVVDAIRYSHGLRVAHRDIKPENLLLSSKDQNTVIKVSDFGLAKYQIPKELMFTACGTPAYVAPEVLKGGGYDLKVDCWSLGVLIYVMLCGFPPFYDEDNNKLFELIKIGNFDFPSPYWDEISSSAKDLISKLLICDPTKRLTADEALKHDWLSGNSNSKKIMNEVPSKIKNFNDKIKPLKVTIYAVLLAKKLIRLLKNKEKKS